jgi:sugar phosphate isomerase/epimerase
MINFSKSIGASTNLFKNPYEVLPIINRLGTVFSVIEIEIEKELKQILFDPENIQEDFIRNLKEIKGNLNLSFNLHAPFLKKETDLASSDEARRIGAVELMLKMIRLSSLIGASTLTFHPGFIDRNASVDREQYIANLRVSLAVITPEAKKQGITLAMENMGDDRPHCLVLDDEAHEALCNDFGIKLTLDLVHYTTFTEMNEKYFARLKKILPYVANIHLADMNIPKHIHLPLGKGNFAFREVVDFIYTHGYRGKIIVEEPGGNYQAEEYIEAAATYKMEIEERENDHVLAA